MCLLYFFTQSRYTKRIPPIISSSKADAICTMKIVLYSFRQSMMIINLYSTYLYKRSVVGTTYKFAHLYYITSVPYAIYAMLSDPQLPIHMTKCHRIHIGIKETSPHRHHYFACRSNTRSQPQDVCSTPQLTRVIRNCLHWLYVYYIWKRIAVLGLALYKYNHKRHNTKQVAAQFLYHIKDFSYKTMYTLFHKTAHIVVFLSFYILGAYMFEYTSRLYGAELLNGDWYLLMAKYMYR